MLRKLEAVDGLLDVVKSDPSEASEKQQKRGTTWHYTHPLISLMDEKLR